jgi:hypothetical protein
VAIAAAGRKVCSGYGRTDAEALLNACRIACEGVVDTTAEADLTALLEPDSELKQVLKEAGCEEFEPALQKEELGLAELLVIDREDLRRTLNVPPEAFARLWGKISGLRAPSVPDEVTLLREENQVSVMARQKLKSLLQLEEPPEYLMCPLSQNLLSDPVTMSDGLSYERQAAQDWLSTHDVSPVTGQQLPNRTLRENINLKKVVDQYRIVRGGVKGAVEPRRNLYATSYGHHLPDPRLQELADLEREATRLAGHFFRS